MVGGISNTRAALAPRRAGRLCTRTNPNRLPVLTVSIAIQYMEYVYTIIIYISRSGRRACHVLQKPVKPEIEDGCWRWCSNWLLCGSDGECEFFSGFLLFGGSIWTVLPLLQAKFSNFVCELQFFSRARGCFVNACAFYISFARAYTWRAFT